ncbi:Ribokinase-like protein [Lasiosphaeria miniovina]|uniref:Ribokinase-like protein n=1 Tax=Lasiosphaeria miniovina TaxID=1954250 RepID=A0AA40EDE5_9PEZI|nr:Ribokinase-like protein [Lasiosphaeria miniovina]KAK0734272.1 Ribokinase-like protein [Lasiosphaeria miniovina]
MGSYFSKSSDDKDPIFVSLGMAACLFRTDTLGARMTDTAAAHPKKVGCCVLAGSDFPDSVEQAIVSWGIALTIKRDPSRLSTRGLLKYSGDSFKGSQDAHLRAVNLVDVYSPNHLEFLATFGSGDGHRPSTEFDCAMIEELVAQVLKSGVGRDGGGAAVIRCAEHGCVVAARSYSIQWFPAFHSSSRVLDATGAGNAFLGAFAVTLSTTSDLTEAAIAGSVAASFVVEQVGMPRRTSSSHGEEQWNGEAFSARIDRFRTMMETAAKG